VQVLEQYEPDFVVLFAQMVDWQSVWVVQACP
jgi:hypothetical protein